MKMILICHEEDELNRVGLACWLASFCDLAGIISLRETPGRRWQRVRREVKRVGFFRFLDIAAFRLYYRLFLAGRDRRWQADLVAALCRKYGDLPPDTRVLSTSSPNTPEAARFIRELQPDLMIARCKTLLKEEIFSLPRRGVLVMHPGICPEYRNAHGCFWALANDDLERVGMTLLKIDKGVDTGPVYGHYTADYDEVRESHIVIQHRVVFDNLEALQSKLLEIDAGRAVPIDTTGRRSAAWGQPWLSRYLRWKLRARRRRAAGCR